jgi:RNA polymerase sigma factor (sigma-70 family)
LLGTVPELTEAFILKSMDQLTVHAKKTVLGVTRDANLARQAAEDLYSTIYESASKSMDKFDGWVRRASYDDPDVIRIKYLKRIAERRALDWAERHLAEQRRMVDPTRLTRPDGSPGDLDDIVDVAMSARQSSAERSRHAPDAGPEEALLASERARQVQCVLRVLSEKERDTLLLSGECDDMAEAAGKLGVATGTLRVTVHRTRAVLRTALWALENAEEVRKNLITLPVSSRSVMDAALRGAFDPAQTAAALGCDEVEAVRRTGRALTSLQRVIDGGFIPAETD